MKLPWNRGTKESSAARRTGVSLTKPEFDALRNRGQRGYDAAKQSRLRSNWATQNVSIDYDTRVGLSVLRARARDAEANNGLAKKYLNMAVKNVVGPYGFTLQVKANRKDGTIDVEDSKAVRDAFYDWAKAKHCDLSGKKSLVEIQQTAVRARHRDGEYLLRFHRGKAYGKYAFQVQLLDTDRLDIELNKQLQNGNIIKMGVEINRDQKPVAYYLRIRHPGDYSHFWQDAAGNVYERVPASDIRHGFISMRPEQTRGIPELHAALVSMEHLGKFRDSAIVAAEIGAAQSAFWTSEDGTAEGLADDEGEDGTLYTDVEAGQIGVAPAGYELAKWDPKYPSEMYGPFTKEAKRDIATSLDVTYHTLGNDLEGVNFSSIRAGTLDERDGWMMEQEWFIGALMDDIYSEWLTMALLNGAILDAAGVPLPSFRLDKYLPAGKWQGRRWPWVDPYKDMQTAVLAVQNRLKTRTKVMAENGDDFDDSIDEMAAEDKKMKAAGVTVMQAQTTKPTPAEPPPEEN